MVSRENGSVRLVRLLFALEQVKGVIMAVNQQNDLEPKPLCGEAVSTLEASTHEVAAKKWFCIRTQPKHEHIAASNLRLLEDITVFNPRIRARKATRRGPVWFTESLFPNYLFLHCCLDESLNEIRYTSGVSTIVHFGYRFPVVPDEVVEDLRRMMNGRELQIVDPELEPGDDVTVADGRFLGMDAVVLRVMPAKARVQILLEFLGRATPVELNMNAVVVKPGSSDISRQTFKL